MPTRLPSAARCSSRATLAAAVLLLVGPGLAIGAEPVPTEPAPLGLLSDIAPPPAPARSPRST